MLVLWIDLKEDDPDTIVITYGDQQMELPVELAGLASAMLAEFEDED